MNKGARKPIKVCLSLRQNMTFPVIFDNQFCMGLLYLRLFFFCKGIRKKNLKSVKSSSNFKSSGNFINSRKELCRSLRLVGKMYCGSTVKKYCRQTGFTAFYRTLTFVLSELKKYRFTSKTFFRTKQN